jgi:hypothetical protein
LPSAMRDHFVRVRGKTGGSPVLDCAKSEA